MKINFNFISVAVIHLVLLLFTVNLVAQNTISVSGNVIDEKGESLIGASVILKKDRSQGVITDFEGNFTLKGVTLGDILVFSYIGYSPKEVQVTSSQEQMKVTLEPDQKSMYEVVVVGREIQRKISVTGAVTNVKGTQVNAPGTTISNMLGGVVPGIIAMTRSGEPGQDMSQFWIRGISTFGANASALVLIDGIEGNINDIDAADVESISVLKDASATAVYGVRGANGVVLITTKSGEAGKLKIMARSNVTLSYSPRKPKYLGAYDYARLANEARLSSDMDPLYSDTEMEIIKNGLDLDLYPDVNWQDEILKDFTINHQHYTNVSGGGDIARYYISLGALMKSAVFKQDKVNVYDTNVRWNRYNVKAKVDANITKSTIIAVNVDATIVDNSAPGYGDDNNALWAAQANMTPLTVPLRYSNGLLPGYGKNGYDMSPYVLLNHTGYKTNNRTTTNINVDLKQDFSSIHHSLKGLTGKVLFSYHNNSVHAIRRRKTPNTYKAYGRYNDGSLMLERTNTQQDMAVGETKSVNKRTYFETQLNYEKSFKDIHRITGMLHYYMQSEQATVDQDINAIKVIPKRYQALSARATYGLKDTYFLEGNLGYTGTENFQPGHQFGVFPSISAGWIPTQYEFVQKAIPALTHFKIRGSYGEVGNDKIQNEVRFPYLTIVDFTGGGVWGSGITENRIGADNLEWEVAKKYNLGFDFGLLNGKIEGSVDIFKDTRDNIFQERQMMPAEVGVVTNPYTNVGRMRSGGIDGHISYNHTFNNENSFTVRANLTYAYNKIVHWDQDITKYPYMSYSGYIAGLNRGLVALGLFKDEDDIQASPKQTFGVVRPGDIKYKDVNGDGKINDEDIVPLKNSNTPQMQYGLALEYRHRNWIFSALFEGVGKTNYFYQGAGFYPFAGGEIGNVLSIVGDQENRWTPREISGDPSTENPNARFPRLTYGSSANNNRNSTYWLANGAYLRFKSLDISYRINSNPYFEKIGLNSLIIQFVGNNLATWDSVKLWDPGQATGNGGSYPVQRTFSLQLTANF